MIQRYNPVRIGNDGFCDKSEVGDFVTYHDHLKAMHEQEERMLRFAEWLVELPNCIFENKRVYAIRASIVNKKQAFAYWEKEVEGMK